MNDNENTSQQVEDITWDELNNMSQGNSPIVEHEFEVAVVENETEESEESEESEEEEGEVEVVSTKETDTENPENTPITPNSPSLLVDEATIRFSGAEWFKAIQETNIILGGCGGISSNVAFQLARMHPKIMLIYDNDIVEKVNMAGQLYSFNDIGTYKVNAVAKMIRAYTNMTNIYAINQRFTTSTEGGNIMISGFDNMLARHAFFQVWHKHVSSLPEDKRSDCLLIDGRLSMDTFQILTLTGDDKKNIKRYKDEFLFYDSEAEATVCSMKQTTYLACMIGSMIVNLFTNFVANTINPTIPYDLPFFLEYDAPNMLFHIER